MAKTGLQVTGVRVYPVKSMEGNYVESARMEPWGLAGDRRWALVNADGGNLTARRINGLLGLRAEIAGDAGIRIADRSGNTITVDAPRSGSTISVGFDGLDRATPAASAADAWLSERAGAEVRLVWQEDPTARPVAHEDGGVPGDVVSLADAAPLLLVTQLSMDQLNTWVAENPENAEMAAPLDIVRFRPNVIIDGDVPFGEDNWARITIGGIEFRRTEMCDRCSIPTIDPLSLERGKEPTRTLAQHRMWDQKTWFGIRIAPVNFDATGTNVISVGDAVEVELD
ncbi:MAG: MOSC N-terminal beta barrel domain-containing protein [Terrimesophilobacter sp.]